MTTTITLKSEPSTRDSGGTQSMKVRFGSPVEDSVALGSSYEQWFKRKVADGLAAATAGEFATDDEIHAALSRYR